METKTADNNNNNRQQQATKKTTTTTDNSQQLKTIKNAKTQKHKQKSLQFLPASYVICWKEVIYVYKVWLVIKHF